MSMERCKVLPWKPEELEQEISCARSQQQAEDEAARARDSSAASGIAALSFATTLGTAYRARCRGRRLAATAAAASRAAARIMRPPAIPDGAGARHPARRATARVCQHATAGPCELGSQAVQ